MIIALLGYMGCGKSTIGRDLAKVLGYTFLDLDDYIEEQENETVTNIFKNKGEIYFRKKEHLYLEELISKKEKIVLSLGGGTPCYANNMGLLANDVVRSIYLSVSIKELTSRLFKEKDKRPLIANIKTTKELQGFIGVHLFERNSFYSKATITLKTDGLTKEGVVEAIIKELY